MLVLSRKKDQVIRISDCISIKVLEIRGDYVRLGVTAPQEVRVDREEIWLKNEEYKNANK